jgi:oligoribonuclease
MTIDTSRILWVDLEGTGLNAQQDVTLEIGVRITDVHGSNLGERTSLVWSPNWRPCLMRNENVFEMHRASGLLDDLENLDRRPDRHRFSPDAVARATLDWIASELGVEFDGKLPMAGNSVHYDRSFMTAHMPHLVRFWHYRNLDISAMREACRLASPTLFTQMPTHVKAHRPQADIDESVKLWNWLYDNFFWSE